MVLASLSVTRGSESELAFFFAGKRLELKERLWKFYFLLRNAY
jgi:hypothetical protein